MWIEELPNGKYKFIERYYDDKTGKHKKVSTTLSTNSRQAWNKATQILNKKIEKYQNKSSITPITFEVAFDEWFKLYSHSVKPITVTRNTFIADTLKTMIDPDILVDKINTSDLEKYLNIINFDKNYSNSTTRQTKSIFNMFFSYCENRGYISKNPTNHLNHRYKKENITPMSDRYLTKEELNSLVSTVRQTHKRYADMTEIMALTGMRYGEMVHLKKTDIVNKTIQIKDSKTPTGIRPIPLDNRAYLLIIEIIEENMLAGLMSDYIFITAHENLINNQNFNMYLKQAAKKCDIQKNVSAHMLRRTHITMLAEMNIPLKTIMNRVGHAKPNVTLEIYTFVTSKMEQEVIDKLNEFCPFSAPFNNDN
ncbi:tyrosine-type recombinase/integrase [Eremococcus coleocola]|uniref:tyrosine-type recombinase/integrase n=1 Tax=Eremococcus coleocola TaxID=88132 RepID=UPI000428824F|nr:tyrosine-type recombinase/integrase [Eremococcus coleocola]